MMKINQKKMKKYLRKKNKIKLLYIKEKWKD